MTKEIQLPENFPIAHGAHGHFEDGACALELVDYLDRKRNGRDVGPQTKLTDSPACVCPVIAAFVRRWNDDLLDDATRTRLLAPLLPVMLDTAATVPVQTARAWLAIDWLVRVHAPAWLALAKLDAHAKALRALPVLDNTEALVAAQPVIEAARAAAWAAARAAAGAAAGAAAWAAAWAAAGAAARAAARAAAWEAAGAAAGAAAWAAAWAAAGAITAPVVAELQTSAQDLVRRMCAHR